MKRPKQDVPKIYNPKPPTSPVKEKPKPRMGQRYVYRSPGKKMFTRTSAGNSPQNNVKDTCSKKTDVKSSKLFLLYLHRIARKI